jgi:hypothetical protein
LLAERVNEYTRWPAATRARTSGTPMVPVPPAMKMVIWPPERLRKMRTVRLQRAVRLKSGATYETSDRDGL